MSLTKVPSSMTSFEGTTFNGEVRSYDSADQGNFVGGASGTANRIQIRGASHPSTPNVITMDTNGSEKLRLSSSGNLGLGVTPSAWGTSIKALQIGTLSALYDTGSLTRLTNNVYNDSVGNKYLSTAAASLYSQQSGSHAWYTAPSGTAGNAITFTQAMTLDASGNLGLGVTPSAWKSGYTAFENAAGSLTSNGPTLLLLSQNSYASDSGTLYKNTGYASRYYQYLGQHVWLTAPSGTAGNAITWTQAMTLDSSGNLTISGSTATKASGTTWANPSDHHHERFIRKRHGDHCRFNQ